MSLRLFVEAPLSTVLQATRAATYERGLPSYASEGTVIGLTVTMVVLTVVMVGLTALVAFYACRTLKASRASLRATKESLDFFAKPLVAFRGTRQMSKQLSPSTSYSLDPVTLVNESAFPILVESHSDFRVAIAEVDPAGFQKLPLDLSVSTAIEADGIPLKHYPAQVRSTLTIPVKFRAKPTPLWGNAPVSGVVVRGRLAVRYVYRNREFVTEPVDIAYTVISP